MAELQLAAQVHFVIAFGCPRAVMAYVDHFTTTSRVNFQRQLSDGALVQWLWEETRVPKVVGLNPSTVYWMDIFHMYLL